MLNNKYVKSIINILIILLIILIILFFIIPWADWNQDKIKEAREKYENNINN
jgi:competence protein ComGC